MTHTTNIFERHATSKPARAGRSHFGSTGQQAFIRRVQVNRCAMGLFGLLLLASLPGCTLCLNAKRTLIDEPTRFSWPADRKRSVEVYRAWADEAWGTEYSSNPDPSVSEPYEVGFKDGFVDYVYAGGTGEPPPVAPREYWNIGRRNPHGHAAAAQWFAGYRLGAQVAREGGYRERALAPTQAMLLGPDEGSYDNGQSLAEPYYQQPTPNWSQAEPIPLGPATSAPDAETREPALAVPPSEELAVEVPEPDELPSPNIQVEPQDQIPTPSSEIDSPGIESPARDVPQMELPPTDSLPASDALPTEPQLPIENPPAVEPKPTDEIDDIFGPPTAFQSTSTSSIPRHLASQTSVSNKERHADEARAAFASAIRKKSKVETTANSTTIETLRRSGRTYSTQHRHNDPQALSPAKRLPSVVPTVAISDPQPQSIPQSEDQAAEMFQRLSQ